MQEKTLKLLEGVLAMDQTLDDETRERIIEGARQGGGNETAGGRLLTIKQAAELLSVHEKSVWVILKREQIPVVRLGEHRRRVRKSDIDALIAQGVGAEGARRTLPHEFHAMKEGAAITTSAQA